MTVRLLEGDCRTLLPTLPAESVHCCATSPPYWGLRDYGVEGQLGLERSPPEYVAALVEVLREVRRVLRKDGTLWLNMGDTYATGAGSCRNPGGSFGKQSGITGAAPGSIPVCGPNRRPQRGLKAKDMVGIPWRVAFALQDDGWYLRSDCIWAKSNPLPESVTDRPTKAHEYIFLLSKSRRYYYDAAAIAEPMMHPADATAEDAARAFSRRRAAVPAPRQTAARLDGPMPTTRNRRSVWTIPTAPYPGAHFATFPPALAEIMVKAGCPDGGTVLDPFAGAGTTLLVADRLCRHAIGIELNPDYVTMARERIFADAPLLAEVLP